MARTKRTRVNQYDFTYPGTAAFYEGMESDYLRELYTMKIHQHDALIGDIVKYPYKDKAVLRYMENQLEALQRQALTIQQILNSRASE